MNKMLTPLLKEKWFMITAGLLLLLFFYGSCSGRRICNCKATQSWKPGQEKSSYRSGGHYGRSNFYHK